MSGTDDLASIFAGRPEGGMLFGQGTLLSWNSDDFSNRVQRGNVVYEDLPVWAGLDAQTFTEGQQVVLLGWDATGGRGTTQWWILGRLTIPGATEFAKPIPDELTAKVVNTETLNADQINVDGTPLDDYIRAFITEQVPASDPEPPPGGSVKLKKTYNASWSALYQGNGSRNTFLGGIAQGYWSSTNGNQRSLIGFPTSTIQSDLSAATALVKVEVFLYFDHWLNNSGGTAILGHHGHTSAPSSFSADTNNVQSAGWPKPGGRWVTYDVGTGLQGWASGARTGIALGPGPSTSGLYYGRARAHNESSPPRLRITWEEPE